jgi:hypothetical protein
MSEVIEAEKLKQIITKIETIEQEKIEASDLLKDVFNEAKSMGFDVKIIKHVRRLRHLMLWYLSTLSNVILSMLSIYAIYAIDAVQCLSMLSINLTKKMKTTDLPLPKR